MDRWQGALGTRKNNFTCLATCEPIYIYSHIYPHPSPLRLVITCLFQNIIGEISSHPLCFNPPPHLREREISARHGHLAKSAHRSYVHPSRAGNVRGKRASELTLLIYSLFDNACNDNSPYFSLSGCSRIAKHGCKRIRRAGDFPSLSIFSVVTQGSKGGQPPKALVTSI